jgi:glycosidase
MRFCVFLSGVACAALLAGCAQTREGAAVPAQNQNQGQTSAANPYLPTPYVKLRHPEWYDRDYKGDFRPTPLWDWSDIIDLDFKHEGLRRYMTDAMKYWVREADVDGYRCDVAGFVPVDFWNNVRRELDASTRLELKPWDYRVFVK